MKVKKFEKFRNKIGSSGCKWSSLNVSGTKTSLSDPYLELGEFLVPLGGDTDGFLPPRFECKNYSYGMTGDFIFNFTIFSRSYIEAQIEAEPSPRIFLKRPAMALISQDGGFTV